MQYNVLRERVLKQPVFSFEDIFKYFPDENPQTVKLQLFQWVKKGYLNRIKRGLFILKEAEINDEFALTSFIYSPSYISLESALNSYGIISDIPFAITSVTLHKTKTFKTPKGLFSYRHLAPKLYFGFITAGEPPFVYNIAQPEKALLDYLYLNPYLIVDSFWKDYRFDLEDLNWTRLKNYAQAFKNKKINKAMKILNHYHVK